MKRIYADINATMPLRLLAKDAMAQVMDMGLGNPSSPHLEGRKARRMLEDARIAISDCLNIDVNSLVFTASGSESNNLALNGFDYVAVSAADHPSCLNVFAPHKVRVLKLDSQGLLDLSDLEDFCKGQSSAKKIVSVAGASGVTGIIQNYDKIAEICHEFAIPYHCDISQLIGKVEIKSSLCNTMTISSHKLGGPTGIAGLIVRDDKNLTPNILGGHQEAGRRAGTESVLLAVGFASAMQESLSEIEKFTAVAKFRDQWEEKAINENPSSIIVGKKSCRLPNTSCFLMPDINGELAVMEFDLAGVAVSHGSACSWGSKLADLSLQAMGYSDTLVESALRFSFDVNFSTADQVNHLLDIYKKLYKSHDIP